MVADTKSTPPVPSAPPAEAAYKPFTTPALAAAVSIALWSFALYFPSFSNHFVDYDDHHYVTANKVVQRGITRDGVVWAFTTTKFANWLPVTWLSHMLDCELFGLNAGGHHATSAALHAFNAAALFFALRMMTGRFWPPAVVAAVFAVHPLRVESVSWVAERKDVLCGTFFMLALLAYTAYGRRPTFWRYTAVLTCHALGLMSKTMLVTLPCVLLLMDYWPLRRLRLGLTETDPPQPFFPPRPLPRLLLEKLPLVVLSLVSSAWTVVFQSTGGAMWGTRDLTLLQRLANAVVAVPRYLAKIAWPANLSVFYPHPGSWPAPTVVAAAALVILLTVAALAAGRRRPYLAVGWFWFLGMLVPVSGVIQVGLQSMADRYTYLPGIGLLIAIVWWAADALRNRPSWSAPALASTAAVAVALSATTWKQQKHWENTLTLFQRALDVDPDNWLALNMVGSVYSANAERQYGAGDAASGNGFSKTAVAYFEKSLAAKPDHYATLHNYGWSLYRLGRLDEAIPNLEEAARLVPDDPNARVDLAEVLFRRGRKDEAIAQLKEALRVSPGNENAKRAMEWAIRPGTQPTSRSTSQPVTRPATQPAQ